MNSAIDSIAAVPGVAGVVLHRRDLILSHRLPDEFPLHAAVALCTAVSRAFAAYAGAGRLLREAWFEFPGCPVLVVARPGDVTEEFLTLLLSGRDAVASAARAAHQFWKSP